MTHKSINSFVMYQSFATQFSLLTMEQRGALITAIFNYNSGGETGIELDDVTEMAFSCMRYAFDRDRQAYIEKCEKNRENGKKGGRPRKETGEKTEGFFEKAKKAYNKDNNKNDNDNDNEFYYEDGDRNKNYNKNNNELYCEDKDRNEDTLSYPIPAYPIPNIESEEEELERLLGGEVPREYIEERMERAREHARMKQAPLCDVLRLWWNNDRALWRSEKQSLPKSAVGSKYTDDKLSDCEAWFNARVEQMFGDGGT